MSGHVTFHFGSAAELEARIREDKLPLQLDHDFQPLFQSVRVGGFVLPNRFVVLPMEGCDGEADGSPGPLTIRRYERFAGGGAGLLWFEATAVVQEGRANPRQLWLHAPTVPAFRRLVERSLAVARERVGADHRPLLIVQLTHSGRYSRPGRAPAPIIAHHSPLLDPTHKLPPDYPLITDDELERLEDQYVEAARCAREAGFDGVDIKACHRYLVSELHASFTRENSRYGGPSFEDRTRFLRNVVAKVRASLPDLVVTSRMNVFDAMAHPYGFGMDASQPGHPDLTEPIRLVRFLKDRGAPVVNITVGNPYFNPHVNRPFDLPTAGSPIPEESPLYGVARFMGIVRLVQTEFPDLPVIGGGYTWLRQFLPHVAAANVRRGWVSLIGLGRLAFAYPDCVRDLRERGRFDSERVCVACSACTQIMRDGGRSGCVPRDAEVYEPIYKEGRAQALDTIQAMARTCRQCNDPTCVGKCPALVNIPEFVGHIASGRFREAYESLRRSNTLAAVCGYVCPAEVQCEGGCINQHYSNPVPIRHLQQWIGRKAVEEDWVRQPRAESSPTGRRVAVIGAGPAGVAAADKLAGLGHQVVLFEREGGTGGAAREVIPRDRLPDSILRGEIQGVIASHQGRIEVQPRSIGSQCTLDQLFQEGYQAVLLATGLGETTKLPSSNRPRVGVEGATEFLARLKNGQRVSGVVRVLGGGNSAIDAAVCAKESGADDVSIVYRRSFAEMPAWPQEREQALRHDVNIMTLTAPADFVSDAIGKLTGLRVVRTRLGAAGPDGRRMPEVIPGTEHVLPADLVVEALGQSVSRELRGCLAGVEFLKDGLVRGNPTTMETTRPGVYAAGDVVNGGTTVVRAVAEGVRAAMQIDAFLRGA
jgi:2,4-dienoyl-CoA reductase (NADPH2)